MSEEMKSHFRYKQYIVRDLTNKNHYVFGNSSDALKKYDELSKDNPKAKLLYEIVFPNYKSSTVEHLKVLPKIDDKK